MVPFIDLDVVCGFLFSLPGFVELVTSSFVFDCFYIFTPNLGEDSHFEQYVSIWLNTPTSFMDLTKVNHNISPPLGRMLVGTFSFRILCKSKPSLPKSSSHSLGLEVPKTP